MRGKADTPNTNITRSLFGAIMAISVPAIVTNVTVPVLGITDVAIAGHLGSTVSLAAIAVGTNMFNLLYWLFNFLRMGSSGLTAQAYGSGNSKAAAAVLCRAVLIALGVGSAMIIFRNQLCTLLLDSMDVTGATRDAAECYFMIRVWAAPATLGAFAFTGWFVGMQNSRVTMWISLFVNVLNIAFSLLLVFVYGMALDGLAAGTVIAQWGGIALSVTVCALKFKPHMPCFGDIINWGEIKRFFAINTDIFLRTLCLIAVTLWFTRAGAAQGDTMLAVNALLMQLFTIFSFFMDGFAFAGEALCGKFKGACNPYCFKKTVWLLICIGGTIAAVFTVVYALAGSDILSLLTDDIAVENTAKDYIWWAVGVPLAGFMAFTWDGIFIGTTETRPMLASMAGAMIVFFTVYSTTFDSLGNNGLWLSFISYLVVRGVALTILARRFNRLS